MNIALKLVSALLIFLFIILFSSHSQAAMSAPTCNVTARIDDVIFSPGKVEIEAGLCYNRAIQSYYIVDVTVLAVDTLIADGKISCEDKYLKNPNRVFKFRYEFWRNNIENRTINATVHFGGDDCNGGDWVSSFDMINDDYPAKNNIIILIGDFFRNIFRH